MASGGWARRPEPVFPSGTFCDRGSFVGASYLMLPVWKWFRIVLLAVSLSGSQNGKLLSQLSRWRVKTQSSLDIQHYKSRN